MTRIIVRGSLVSYPYGDVLRNAYLYLEGGGVQALGEEPAPPEHSYADLVVGGEGRLAVPGIVVGLVQPALHPFLPTLGNPSLVGRLKDLVDCSLAEKASLLTFSELALNGVSLAGIQGPYPECAVRAAERVGIQARVVGKDRVFEPGGGVPEGGFILGLGGRVSYDPRGLAVEAARIIGVEEAAKALFRREALGLEPYTVPGPGDVAVLRPRIPQPIKTSSLHYALLSSVFDVETLIVGGEPVVDGGELLTLDMSELEEAGREVGEALDQVKG